MNDEVLGNIVAHLDWHLVPRNDWDPNPKGPILAAIRHLA
jgi:diadenosine tetraphosphate (Ap4A) HIT family hydrolase